MGDAARDIGPGGGSLGGHQIGDIVEGNDQPATFPGKGFR